MIEDSEASVTPPVRSIPATDRFSPEQVRRILQRASEIDAHGEHASAEELLRVAREAGIDLHAMELAIAEVADGVELGDPPTAVSKPKGAPVAPRGDTLVPSILGGAVVGLVGGMLLGLAPFTWVAGLGIGGLFLFALVRAAQLGRKGALLEFEVQNLVTMALGMATAIPSAGIWGEDVALVLLMLWMVTTVLGGGLVWWLGRDAPDGEDDA
jgi:hypothetical protein